MKTAPLERTGFTQQNVLDLIHSAFQQWKERGIDSSLLSLTLEQFIERTSDSTVFVTVGADGELIGTTTCSIVSDMRGCPYAFNKYSAVSSHKKNSGIGTELLNAVKQFAIKHNCRYVISDTIVLAPWSVRWHKKNGFRIIGYTSFSNNDYYSYIFRYQLKSSSIWNYSLYTNFRFICSYLKTRATKRADGSLTGFGNIIAKFFNMI